MLKKCAIINDLSGFGNCSLVSQIAILSYIGIEVHPLPTAVLSNQTEYPSYTVADLSEYFSAFTDEWKKLDAHFDAMLTGYFTCENQINYIMDLYEDKTVLLVDPVMGSNGKKYPGFTDQLCRKIGELSFKADIVTPNMTELEILTGETSVEDGVKFLLQKGVKNVIVTGIRDNDKVKNMVFNNDTYAEIINHRWGGDFSGSGDIFSAIVLGEYINGNSIFDSAKKASEFIELCAKNTSENDLNNGLAFSKYLSSLKERK